MDFTVFKSILIFLNGRKKRITAKDEFQRFEEFSLGCYKDDDVITWRGYITQAKAQARAQPLTEVQKHSLSPPFTIHSHPLCYFLRLG